MRATTVRRLPAVAAGVAVLVLAACGGTPAPVAQTYSSAASGYSYVCPPGWKVIRGEVRSSNDSLVTIQVLDLTDAATERIGLYDIQTPMPEARELAAVLLAQTRKMQEAVHGLRNVKESKKILDACMEINSLENQADSLLRRALADLFRSGADPLTIIKWKEILDLIETATDRAEDVANVIENVVLENT